MKSFAVSLMFVSQVTQLSIPQAQAHSFEQYGIRRDQYITALDNSADEVERELTLDALEVETDGKIATKVQKWEARLLKRIPKGLRKIRKELAKADDNALEQQLHQAITSSSSGATPAALEINRIARSDLDLREKLALISEINLRVATPVLAKKIVEAGGAIQFVRSLRAKINEMKNTAQTGKADRTIASASSMSDAWATAIIFGAMAALLTVGFIFLGVVMVFLSFLIVWIGACIWSGVTGEYAACD